MGRYSKTTTFSKVVTVTEALCLTYVLWTAVAGLLLWSGAGFIVMVALVGLCAFMDRAGMIDKEGKVEVDVEAHTG